MTRTKGRHVDTRTIQTWPGGASYQYRGDPHGPANQRSLRAGHAGDAANPWRKGAADEWRAIRIALRAERYQETEILCCDSSLVDDLIKQGNGDLRGDLARAFAYDEIRNLYIDPSDWDAAQCRSYAEDYGFDLPDQSDCGCSNPTKIVLRGSADPSCAACGAEWPNEDDDDGPHGWLTHARDECRSYSQENPAEVFEWWRVTSWLCEQLDAIGEPTIDNGYGHWWGRTCSGQGLIMDGTLQKIAARAEREADHA